MQKDDRVAFSDIDVRHALAQNLRVVLGIALEGRDFGDIRVQARKRIRQRGALGVLDPDRNNLLVVARIPPALDRFEIWKANDDVVIGLQIALERDTGIRGQDPTLERLDFASQSIQQIFALYNLGTVD